jgi:hypothetical protein
MSLRTLNRIRALVVAGAAVLAAGCFGDDVTPQNTAIAGTWNVVCMPVNEDCPNFAIGFSANGDITELDIDGNDGAQRGTGEIRDGVLSFRIGRGPAYVFNGKLDGGGRSASGALTNFDFDGEQKTTAAVATRQ